MTEDYLPPALPHPMQRSVRPPTDKQLRQLSLDSMFALAKALHRGNKRKAIKDALLPLISNRKPTA
jgi:hypothetical protein